MKWLLKFYLPNPKAYGTTTLNVVNKWDKTPVHARKIDYTNACLDNLYMRNAV